MDKNSSSQELKLVNRQTLSLSGVEKVFHFQEDRIKAKTNLGNLEIRGKDLFIEKLDLEQHELAVVGEIKSLIYLDQSTPESEGFLSKLFR